MIHGKPVKTRILLALTGIILASWLLTARLEGAGLPDGVTLTVDTGPGPDDVTLNWTGGQPMFGVYRSTAADDVDELINQIAQTTGATWIDTAYSSDLYFYYISSPCVVNPPEVCDGVDNDCDGDIDEDYVPTPTTCGQGPCAGNTGQLICQGGVEVDTCDPYDGASPDWCDGVDNDCRPWTPDGADDPDLGLSCDGNDSDLCSEGQLECVSGNMECSDHSSDNIDVCNGQDDDCDPASADGSEDPLVGVICDGPDGDLCQEGTNSCQAGTIVCSDNSGTNLDVCDYTDNDCNPATPDGAHDPNVGLPCDGIDGDLCEEGEWYCLTGALTCSDNTSDMPDFCDGLDNDCDPSSTDGSEDPQIGASCDSADTDLCADGEIFCAGGSLQCDDDMASYADVCNGIDDDCDPSSPDGSEETIYGTPCDGADSDLCLEGVWDCVAGTMTCSDTSGDNLDVCDGVDNDCNPATPDGIHHPGVGTPCDGPDSDLCNEGEMECINGNFLCNETSFDDLDVCNGIDDDCDPSSPDGSEDPDVGVLCDGPDGDFCMEGTYACVGGSLWCSDQTSTSVELCNGLDDDCDTYIDEDFPGDQPAVCTDGQFYLGTIDGDQGSGMLSDSLWTESWDRFTLREGSSSQVYLSATIRLWSPPETDYDLYVYCASCGGTLAGASTNGGISGHWDTVTVRAEDEWGVDDTIDIIVEVRHYQSNICAYWDLTVQGNTAVETTTCD